jgi:hypothetical protein
MVMDAVKQDVKPKRYNPIPELWEKLHDAICGPKPINISEWVQGMKELK